MVFFSLVTTGWIFDIRLCENSSKSIKVVPNRLKVRKQLLLQRFLRVFFPDCVDPQNDQGLDALVLFKEKSNHT